MKKPSNNMKQLCLALFSFFLIAHEGVHAQDNERGLVTITVEDRSLSEFIMAIESQTSYHFYYDPEQTDSINITIKADHDPISEVLDEALLNTDLLYTIDRPDGKVYITKGQKLLLDLPSDYFSNKQKSNSGAPDEEAFVFDYFQVVENFNSSEENKTIEVGEKSRVIAPGKATITGQVREAKTGQPIIGASIILEEPFIGTATDQFGNYTISLPKGRLTLNIKAIGMRDLERNVILYSSGEMDIELLESVVSLNEVVIRSDRDRNVQMAQMGIEKLTLKSIKQIPSVMGEPDVFRVILTLPGVKTVGEASTGFNVRGGSVDQNLILYNSATIYNPSHLFGFFSAINSDFINSVELYKSSIPAKYGGRLSSVMEITPKYGNKKKLAGAAGIGLVTGKFSVEGPIVKDKTSFIFGGRTTYSDWVLNLLKNDDFKNSSGSFYDANLNLSHEINDKSSLSFTGYLSHDKFQLRSDTIYGYKNQNAMLKWKQKFSENFYGEIAGGFSQYKYNISSDGNPVDAFELKFGVDQYNFQADFTYSLSSRHTLNFGLSTINYLLSPGKFVPLGQESKVEADELKQEKALESALYLEDQFEISSRLTLNVGLRYSMFNYLGKNSIHSYKDGLPMEDYNRIDTVHYSKGENITTYSGPEYRISARYLISDDLSVKLSYNTMRQYIHMLTNSTAVSPTDIWKLSDPNIKPQFGDQLSLGFYKNFKSGLIETSLEGYYKNVSNYLDYKGGAKLTMNHEIETDVIRTEGKAYGVEFMVKKLLGKLNGWVSYSYSRSLLKADDLLQGEIINNGNWYPSNFDKPHDFTFVGNYKFSHRFSLSLNCTYSTGRPITVPIATYQYNGSHRVYYSERNAERISNYFRTDLSMNIEGNHKVHQLTHNSWTIGVYNLTGRKNAYSTYFVSENGVIKGYKLSIFGTAIPYITFNIRF